MSPVQMPGSRRPGGKPQPAPAVPLVKDNLSSMLKKLPAELGDFKGRKVLVVHDASGQIVSVTHVSPDSPYGVGIKPGPGQTVKEHEAEDLQDALKPPDAVVVTKPRAKKRKRS